MTSSDIERLLESSGVKATANRILVFRELHKASHPISLADLEISLSPMDKASIFRVLELFSKKDVIHVIEDGSRSLKYELCHGEGGHEASDQHAHFYCEQCGSIICLDDVSVPKIETPPNFRVKSINFMLKGLCPKCNKDD